MCIPLFTSERFYNQNGVSVTYSFWRIVLNLAVTLYTTCRSIMELCSLFLDCIYVFRMILRLKSECLY